jgi:phasin family protein
MASFTSPMFDFDVSKYFTQFKVPAFDIDAITAIQRKNIEALTAANQIALEGVGTLVRRQSEIVRKSVESYTASFTELMGEGSPEAKVSKQAELAKGAYDSVLANAKELTDIATKTRDDALGLINARVRESLDEVGALVARK